MQAVKNGGSSDISRKWPSLCSERAKSSWFRAGILSMSTILGVYAGSSLLVVSLIWILSGNEYSKGDSRYEARDAAVVAVEGLTAVLEGPACLLAAYAFATKKSYSHILQVAISLGQLYGTAVYSITSYLEGDTLAVNSFYYYACCIFATPFGFGYPHLL